MAEPAAIQHVDGPASLKRRVGQTESRYQLTRSSGSTFLEIDGQGGPYTSTGPAGQGNAPSSPAPAGWKC